MVLGLQKQQTASIDVSMNTALTHLICSENQMTMLDVSRDTKLSYLYCDYNQLTKLDVSKNIALRELNCDSNQLTALDVSKNESLISLYCVDQESKTLSYTSRSDGTYQVNLMNYVPDFSRVRDIEANIDAYVGMSYNSKDMVNFVKVPVWLYYKYEVKTNKYMYVTLKASPKPIITTTSLAKGTVSAKYSVTLKADGAESFAWSISSGSLPNGLSLDANAGKITGKPMKAGKFTFTLKAEANGAYGEKSFSLTIAKAMTISGDLPNSPILQPYSMKLNVSGGVSSYTWTKSKGTLPSGLAINSKTGIVSGIPTEAGTYAFTVKVIDKNKATAMKAYTLTITSPDISGSVKNGTVRKSYSVTFKASGGTAPYTWTKASGTLPSGLKLNKTTGKLSGTPTMAKKYTFKIQATDANGAIATKSCTVTITAPTISGTLPNGVIKASYTGQLTASKGTSPYKWSINSGTLAEGLTLNESNGAISGTPTKAGTYMFELKITDKNKAIATKSYKITITKPTISGSVKNGNVGKSYSVTFKASEGTAPYTWTKASGTLPAGLKIGKTTGKLSGTPTKAGKFTFKIQATDANGATATKSCTVTIKAASSASVKAYTGEYETLSETENKEANVITEEKEEEGGFILHGLNENLNLNSSPETNSYSTIELQVLSDDVLSQGTGRDEDLVSVRANEPVRFIIVGIVNHESEFKVYINDEHEESIIVSDEGMFTLPAEFVHDDFRIHVKAGELESQELYISAEE